MARNQRKYNTEYKVQAVKLSNEIGSSKAAVELRIPVDTLFHGSPKNNRMERFVPPLRSVRRTRSHRMKFCVQKGAWGHCPQQADGRQCECVLTLALLARRVCGYPHVLLACRI